ncbi:MAG: nonstructural protein [Microviridae sp.]|nr:MAG: nonstructural protein [Microviridae sp.]
MITPMFCVYDITANLFGAPFLATNAPVAIRQFQQELTNEQVSGPMQTHPQDFKLFEVAVFNNEHGRILPHDQPLFLYQGSAKN